MKGEIKLKTAIIYASQHHNNTKKLIDTIAQINQVDLIDATQPKEFNLYQYDLIGLASGIYYGKFHQSLLNFASANLPKNKEVFLICTYGGKPVFQSVEAILEGKHCRVKGKGYDTFGPFKLIGGIAKGHPDEKDLAGAVEFYQNIIQ